MIEIYKGKQPRWDRSIVREVVEKRFYIYGKGYRSNLVAHQQIARRYVKRLAEAYESRLNVRLFSFNNISDYRRRQYLKFMQNRYPYRKDCQCHYCGSARRWNAGDRLNGCWFARMEDYRKIAREIMVGTRDSKGNPIEEVKALPQRCA